MKYFPKIIILVLLVNSCTNNITEPEDQKIFWTVPTDEAMMLYFRTFNSVRVDSVVAGEIQYRLDIAKSVVDDTTIEVHKDWVFGQLGFYINQELYHSFDTNNVRFNNPEIDSLLKLFEIMGIKSRSSTPSINRYAIYLLFPKHYNMVVLSEIFSQVDGIKAEQNAMNIRPICNEDIKLIIDDKTYKFIFHCNCPRHIWVVQVVDDNIKDITDWD